MTTSIFQCSQHGTTSIIHNCIHKRRKNSTICILLWNGSSKYCLSTIKIVSWDHRHKNTLHLLERIQSQNNRSCRGMRLIHCISRAHANESNLTNRPNLGRIFVSSRRGTRTAMVSSKICAAGMGDRIRTFVFSHQCSSTSFWYTSLPTTSDNSIVPSSLNVILNIACIERRPAFNFVQAFWTYNSDLKTSLYFISVRKLTASSSAGVWDVRCAELCKRARWRGVPYSLCKRNVLINGLNTFKIMFNVTIDRVRWYDLLTLERIVIVS